MELSAASLWEWTKMFVRDPRSAASLVKSANLPVETSILMIVLAGVVSTVASGIRFAMIGYPEIAIPISETQALVLPQLGPILQGVFAALIGIGLAYALFRVGARQGGRGSMADIFAVVAVLQLVVTVISVAEVFASLLLPVIGLMLTILSLYVFFRGIGHVVNIGHDFNDMGKSVWVTVLSVVVLCGAVFAVLFGFALIGLLPQGQIIPWHEDMAL